MIANPDRKVLVLWLITVGLITARELRTSPPPPVFGMPRPSAYVGSAVVFGTAAIVSEFAGDLAVLFALGWTIAIGYGTVAAGKGSKATGAAAPATKGA